MRVCFFDVWQTHGDDIGSKRIPVFSVIMGPTKEVLTHARRHAKSVRIPAVIQRRFCVSIKKKAGGRKGEAG